MEECIIINDKNGRINEMPRPNKTGKQEEKVDAQINVNEIEKKINEEIKNHPLQAPQRLAVMILLGESQYENLDAMCVRIVRNYFGVSEENGKVKLDKEKLRQAAKNLGTYKTNYLYKPTLKILEKEEGHSNQWKLDYLKKEFDFREQIEHLSQCVGMVNGQGVYAENNDINIKKIVETDQNSAAEAALSIGLNDKANAAFADFNNRLDGEADEWKTANEQTWKIRYEAKKVLHDSAVKLDKSVKRKWAGRFADSWEKQREKLLLPLMETYLRLKNFADGITDNLSDNDWALVPNVPGRDLRSRSLKNQKEIVRNYLKEGWCNEWNSVIENEVEEPLEAWQEPAIKLEEVEWNRYWQYNWKECWKENWKEKEIESLNMAEKFLTAGNVRELGIKDNAGNAQPGLHENEIQNDILLKAKKRVKSKELSEKSKSKLNAIITKMEKIRNVKIRLEEQYQMFTEADWSFLTNEQYQFLHETVQEMLEEAYKKEVKPSTNTLIDLLENDVYKTEDKEWGLGLDLDWDDPKSWEPDNEVNKVFHNLSIYVEKSIKDLNGLKASGGNAAVLNNLKESIENLRNQIKKGSKKSERENLGKILGDCQERCMKYLEKNNEDEPSKVNDWIKDLSVKTAAFKTDLEKATSAKDELPEIYNEIAEENRERKNSDRLAEMVDAKQREIYMRGLLQAAYRGEHLTEDEEKVVHKVVSDGINPQNRQQAGLKIESVYAYIWSVRNLGPNGSVKRYFDKLGGDKKLNVADNGLHGIYQAVKELQNSIKTKLNQVSEPGRLPDINDNKLNNITTACTQYFQEKQYKNNFENKSVRYIAKVAATAKLANISGYIERNNVVQVRKVIKESLEMSYNQLKQLNKRWIVSNSELFQNFETALDKICKDGNFAQLNNAKEAGAAYKKQLLELQSAAKKYVEARSKTTRDTDQGQLRLDIARDVYDICMSATRKSMNLNNRVKIEKKNVKQIRSNAPQNGNGIAKK